MPQNTITEVVFIGSDNVTELHFSLIDENGAKQDVDFSALPAGAILEMHLVGHDSNPIIDTDQLDGPVVDRTAGGGWLDFALGTLAGVPEGEYPVRMRIRDSASDQNPTQYLHEFDTEQRVVLKFVDGQ